jgi:hypothetical protein
MAVYVDEDHHPHRGMLMCHMIADSRDELLAMARRIGVSERWIQKPGTTSEHLDICKAKRAIAVKAGAVEVTSRDIVKMLVARRNEQSDE